MPHIHTAPGQHDMTVSAYVVRHVNGEWFCLVHMHKKIDMLMQIGGHIDLDQTPWQALAAELREETGYELAEVSVLQPFAGVPEITDAVVHPAPLLMNTRDVGGGHYHSDTCYAFVATAEPKGALAENESADLRWLTLAELQDASKNGEALQDTVEIYTYLLAHLENLTLVSASSFSLAKPTKGITYKR
jgi:8-oxo-dGTP diphosphatase